MSLVEDCIKIMKTLAVLLINLSLTADKRKLLALSLREVSCLLPPPPCTEVHVANKRSFPTFFKITVNNNYYVTQNSCL